MYPDAVVNPVCSGFTRRIVGGYDQGLMTRPAQVLENTQDGVADAIDVGEEGFGDDSYAHAFTVAAPTFDQVAYGHTGHEICWLKLFRCYLGRQDRFVVTVQPLVQQRQAAQGDRGGQPARNRDGPCRDDRQP